jgi:hypothetical protein
LFVVPVEKGKGLVVSFNILGGCELVCIAKLFLTFLQSKYKFPHDFFSVEAWGEAIDNNLVAGILLLGRLPMDLQFLPFQLYLEAGQSILDIA